MNRKMKALGLALVACFAMSAIAASAAQAVYHSDKEHTILSGSQKGTHSFTVGSGFGSITCSTASFNGTASLKTENTQTITPTYTGCKDSVGGRTVHVTVHGDYRFEGSTVDIVGGAFTLRITAGGFLGECNVTVPAQENIPGVSYHNVAGDVEVTTASTGIDSTTSGGFFNCGVSNGNHTNGTYTGNTTMSGVDTSGAAANISVS